MQYQIFVSSAADTFHDAVPWECASSPCDSDMALRAMRHMRRAGIARVKMVRVR